MTVYVDPDEETALDPNALRRGHRRRCPACWQKVHQTLRHCIEAHWDTAGSLCRGGGEPYRITLAYRPARKFVEVSDAA
jgi:hypothetical protein